MNTKHSEPFYISSNLFDNRRLKRRLCKWMERLRERQKLYMSNMRSHTHSHTHTHMHTHTHAHTHTPASKTERGKQRRCHLMLSRRHVAATLPADITIDLLSDDDEDEEQTQPVVAKAAAPGYAMASGLLLHHHRAAGVAVGVGGTASLQLSTVPNITLVPVELAPAHSSTSTSTMLLMPASSTRAISGRKKAGNTSKRYGDVTSTTTATFSDSIVLTSDDEDGRNDFSRRHIMRSPPPLAPLTFNDTIEEVTVSLVPRNSTIANCQARQRRRQPRDSSFHTGNSHAHAQAQVQAHAHSQNCNAPTTTLPNSFDGYLNVDVASDVTATLPDETTVHTVIANRIYELSLSKLREGLASSGVPEYTHDILPEQLQKLSPAMRAKVAPMVVPSPPAPISLKLSSDLSISLISDDDDCESGGNNGSGDGGGGGGGGSSGRSSDLLHPVVAAAEAHAAAKLLKQQQPQLSVVQHLQYPGHGTPVALPVMALAATSPTLVPSTRRRKLG
ncbi:protein a6 [Drosophila albomicans]|uniref:Protein a6 n=1 Tax=Drosophila albomicans TaxID=7291 RepID=A0A6P8XND8_DROAB|nr:protein a6 [Drosophila albomicans]